MERRAWHRRIAGAATLALVAASTASASADELVAAPMVIDLWPPPGSSHGLASLSRGRITVRAGGVTCTSVTPRSDRQSVTVGTGEQPEACRRTGATLSLENGAGQILFETVALEAGARTTVTNFAPLPPHASGHASRTSAPQRNEPGAEAPSTAFSSLLVMLAALTGVLRRRRDGRPGPA